MNIPFQLDKKLLLRKLLGIGLTDEGIISALLLEERKGKLERIERFDEADKVVDFIKNHPTLTVVISIDSKAVLWNQTEEEVLAGNVDEVFGSQVPNGNITDFYIHYQSRILSFARSETILQLMEPLKDYLDQVVAVFLAPVSLVPLADYLKQRDPASEIALGSYKFSFGGSQWDTIQYSENEGVTHDFDGLEIDSQDILAFSAITSLLNGQKGSEGLPVIVGNYRELFFKWIYSRFRMPVLVGVLIIFLLNSLAFFQINSENEALREQSLTIRQLDEKLTEINRYLEENRKVLGQVESQAIYSFLCDQVGYHRTSGITLRHLAIDPPVTGNSKKEEPFIKGLLVLKGETKNAESFSKWVDQLRRLDWVLEIERERFENKDLRSDGGEFELMIRINEEAIAL